MGETFPLPDADSISALTDQLRAQEKTERRQVLEISATEGGTTGDGINEITFVTNMRAGMLGQLTVVQVPPAASAGDAFVAFITPLLDAAEALCRSIVFINRQKTEIVLLRAAEPFEPKGATKEEPAAPQPALPVGDTSAAFAAFMPFIYEWEGETYENDPDDPGGATKFGIDQRSHPNVDIRNLTKEGATASYWQQWQTDGCTKMQTPYAEVFFNCAVNMGLGRAKSFDKLTGGNASRFLDTQEAYYRQLATNPKRSKYLKGWLNRTRALRQRFNIA